MKNLFIQSSLRVKPMQIIYIALGLVIIFALPIPFRWLPLIGVAYLVLTFSSYKSIPLYDWFNIFLRYKTKIRFPEGSIIQVITPNLPVAIAQDSELVSIIAISGSPSYPMIIAGDQVWTKNTISEEFISQLLQQYDFNLTAIDIVQVIPPLLNLQGHAAEINHSILLARKTFVIIRSNPTNWNNFPALKLRGGDVWAAIRAHAAAVARIQLRLKETGLRARVLSKKGIKNYRILSPQVDAWKNKWGAVIYREKFRYTTLYSPNGVDDIEKYLQHPDATETVHCVRIENSEIGPVSTHLFRYRTYSEKINKYYKDLIPLQGLQKELLYYIQGYGVKFPVPLPASGSVEGEILISTGGVFLGLSQKNNPVFMPLVDLNKRLTVDYYGSKRKLVFLLNNIIDTNVKVSIITINHSKWLKYNLSEKIKIKSLKEYKETIHEKSDVIVLDDIPFLASFPQITIITISNKLEEQLSNADVVITENENNILYFKTRSIIFSVSLPDSLTQRSAKKEMHHDKSSLVQ